MTEQTEKVDPISFSMLTSSQITRLRKIADDRYTVFTIEQLLQRIADSGHAAEDFLLLSEFQLEVAASIEKLFQNLSASCPLKPAGSFLPAVCGLLGSSAATFTLDRPFPHAGYLLASVEAVAKPFCTKFMEGAAVETPDEIDTSETAVKVEQPAGEQE